MAFRVHEIFDSVQFEGAQHGRPTRFIRLHGCNLSCGFCDTPQENVPWIPLSEDMLREVINEGVAEVGFVVITGGEPTLQPLERVLSAGSTCVAIETNGTNYERLKLLKERGVWLTFSPKPVKGWETLYNGVWSLADEIKIIWGCVPNAFIDTAEKLVGENTLLFVQAAWDENNEEIVPGIQDFVKGNRRWRISVQTHKLLGMK